MGRRRTVEELSSGGVVFRRAGNQVLVLVIRDSYRNWGFPKGHVEAGEDAEQAAVREIAEETGLTDLGSHGPLRDIDWYFRFRGQLIHKTCKFFLFESPGGEAVPQREEGISECRWLPVEEAQRTISYANAREVLREAELVVEQLSRA